MGIAEDMGYKQEYGRIAKVRYTHDAMIDIIIAEPMISQGDLAKRFGFTEPWVSRVIGSDSFQARLADRKGELIDPVLVASIEERLRGLAMYSLDVVQEKLRATQDAGLAMQALELSTKALGYGARVAPGAGTQNNFVVMLPQKAATESEWAAAHGTVIEGQALPAGVVLPQEKVMAIEPDSIGIDVNG